MMMYVDSVDSVEEISKFREEMEVLKKDQN